MKSFLLFVLTLMVLVQDTLAEIKGMPGKKDHGRGLEKSKMGKKSKSDDSSSSSSSSSEEEEARYDPATVGEGRYCPTQTDVDAFVYAPNAWPGFNGDANLEAWRALFVDSEDVQFCRNQGSSQNIVDSFVDFSFLLADPFSYEVFDWVSAPGFLHLFDTAEVVTSRGRCQLIDNVPHVLYYNPEGLITQVHQFIIPFEPLERFLNDIISMAQCQNRWYAASRQ